MMHHVSTRRQALFISVILGAFAHCGVARGQEAARYAIVDIGDIGGRGTTPRSINNAGVVVGETLTSEGVIKVFVWTD
ncbi:MAG: hypothetical protein IT430_02050, partial [Phycisphaerales bacterium]|nr:hypothetical protein [Phycisphaerales bacterium]